jgi:hypothetical protein
LGPETAKEIVATLLSAQPKYLEAALDEIDRVHGSFDDYLNRALGVDDSARLRLAELLTEAAIVPQTRERDSGGTRSR